MSNKILKNYISEMDQFLQTFDQEHPSLSKSQRQEIAKYERIYFLRDHENRRDDNKKDIFESLT